MIYFENAENDKGLNELMQTLFQEEPTFYPDGPRPGYNEEVEKYEHLKLHTEGDTECDYAEKMLHKARPNELPDVLAYRKANLDAITMTPCEKVENVLHGIFNPELYSLSFPETPTNITETPKKYFMEGFPVDDEGKEGNVVEWAKETLIHESTTDPYAVAILIPTRETEDDYFSVYVKIFNCCDIYRIGKYIVARESASLIYFVDQRQIFEIRPVKKQDNTIGTEWTQIYFAQEDINLSMRVPNRTKGNYRVSVIEGGLAYLDKALRDDSDKTAVKVMSGYPKYWQIEMPCSAQHCVNGVYRMVDPDSGMTTSEPCKLCKGSGIQTAQGPFNTLSLMHRGKDTDPKPPVGGYIESSGIALEFLSKEVASHIDEFFSSLNMEFLRRQQGANESGYAKDVSRQEFVTTMLSYSGSVYEFMNWLTTTTCFIRYSATFSDWMNFAPVWSPPTNFGMVTATTAIEALKAANDGKVSNSIKSEMESDYAELTFGEESMAAKIARAKTELDPLIDLSADEIMQLTADIRPEDLYIHANLHRMMLDAMDEVGEWIDNPRKDRMTWLYARAKEEMKKLVVPVEPKPDPVV